MDITTPLILNVGILFLMLIPGIVMKRTNLTGGDGFGKGLSNLVLYIAQPALIVSSYISYEGDGKIWLNSLLVFLFSILGHLLFASMALLLFRGAEDGRRRMLRFATIFSNAAFMGIPLIKAILGPEAVIYASIYNITFNIFLWSLGVRLCTSGREEVSAKRIRPLGIIFHPVMISAYLGLLLLGTGASAFVPSLLSDSLVMLGNLVAPLSMVVVGLRLADVSFRGAFRDRYLYLFLFLRHLLLPIVFLLLLYLASLIGIPVGGTVGMVLLILAATPAATSAAMFAEKYDCDAVYTGRSVVLSTLLSILTMSPLALLGTWLLL